MTITEFLEARMAEDEALANAAIAKHSPDEWDNETQTLNLWPEDVALWGAITPARVLAECEAKWKIVDEHELVQSKYVKDTCSTCAEWWASEVGEGPPNVEYPCPTIRALAAVYADHSDYLQEWVL